MSNAARRREKVAYRGALTTYVVALVLVVFLFPGVSNLWVSIFVLVSGYFALLAAYWTAKRDWQEADVDKCQHCCHCSSQNQNLNPSQGGNP